MLGLVYDCKSFLGVLGMCLDQKKGLNYAGIWISVCDFSLEFLNLVLLSQRFLGRDSCMRGLHLWLSMRISHYAFVCEAF